MTEDTSQEELRQRNRELAILNAITEALNREIDLIQALKTTLAKVAELLDLETGWIFLIEEESGEHYLAAAQNLPPGLADSPARFEGSCYCLDTYRAGDMDGAANVNVVTCSRLKNLVDGADGLRYHGSIPIFAHGKELGLLNVASRDWKELSDDDRRLLYTVGDLLGIAIERARLFDKSVELGAIDERNRLAREIHDTLAQGLTAIALQLEQADLSLEGESSDQAKIAVQQALALTRTNLDEARRSVLDLRAAPLEGRSLANALRALADESALKHGLRVDYNVTGANQPLPLRVEASLFRIAQEAINNVVRHAEAEHLTTSLVVRPGSVRLSIEDDGVGFDPAATPGDRFGLVGLNERVKLLGGKLDVQSSPGQGTRLLVTVPLV